MTQSPYADEPTRWSRRLTAVGLTAVLLTGTAAASATTEESLENQADSSTEDSNTETQSTTSLDQDSAAETDPEGEDPEAGQEASEASEDDGQQEDEGTLGASEQDEDPDEAVSSEDESDEQTEETAELFADGEDEGTEEAGAVVDLQILTTNDFHGRVERDGNIAGAEIFACTVDHFRGENPNTLLVGAGDHIGASTFTSWATNDEVAIESLNLWGMDVSTVGNHEFDTGWADFRDRFMPLSEFTWLGANVVDENTGEPILDPYEIHEVGGASIAFIGLNTMNMPNLVSPGGVEGIEWTDLSATANYWAEHIAENEDADLTMVLVHEGLGQPGFAELTENAHEDIFAIVSGHTHQTYAQRTEAGTWVTQTGEYIRNIGQYTIQFDLETREVVDSSYENLPLMSESDEGWDPVYCNSGDRPDVAALVADAVETAEEVGNQVIGQADPGFARAQNQDGSENRSARSTMSDVIADAQAWAARQSANDVDFAVMNPGGVRADLPPGTEGAGGEVTFRDLATIQPFGNLINSVEIDGHGIKEVLELQWREGRDLMLGTSSEFTYTYDPTRDYGDRITGMWLNGEELDLDATYLLAANSFLAEGGDGFTPFAAGNRGTTGQVDMDGFIAFFQQGREGQLEIGPNLAKRSLALTWISDPEAVYSPGEEIAVDLAGLSWNTPGLPEPEALEITLGDVSVGTAQVDSSWPEIGEDNDLRGTAEVRVEVPALVTSAGSFSPGFSAGAWAGGEAEVPLTITEPQTGLELTLMVTVDSAVAEEPDEEDPADEDPAPVEEDEEAPAEEEDPSAEPAGDTDEKSALAQTGATLTAVAAIALALLVLGVLLLMIRRRQASSIS